MKKAKEGQNKIYYVFGNSYQQALNSPFYEPFKGTDTPVLILTNQLDEIILSQSSNFKDFTFVNIEQADIDVIRKDLGLEASHVESQLPEEDVTGFCLWLKDQFSHKVDKVKLSTRVTTLPAILIGKVSSQMFMMMQMMQQQANTGPTQEVEYPKDLTLEINASHPTIINLNILRKEQPAFAKEISKVLLDHVLIASNIPTDVRETNKRSQDTI